MRRAEQLEVVGCTRRGPWPHKESHAASVRNRLTWGPGAVLPARFAIRHGEETAVATKEELTKAYHAFKKKLKLTRLDDESGLSRGTKVSKVLGITPPYGFPPEVWEELVKQGKLRREGGGTYSIATHAAP